MTFAASAAVLSVAEIRVVRTAAACAPGIRGAGDDLEASHGRPESVVRTRMTVQGRVRGGDAASARSSGIAQGPSEPVVADLGLPAAAHRNGARDAAAPLQADSGIRQQRTQMSDRHKRGANRDWRGHAGLVSVADLRAIGRSLNLVPTGGYRGPGSLKGRRK